MRPNLSVPNLHQKITSPNHLEATFIYPLNGRTMSTPKLNPQTTEDLREKYWGTNFKISHKNPTLHINKIFALNEMFQKNASKFAIFYV